MALIAEIILCNMVWCAYKKVMLLFNIRFKVVAADALSTQGLISKIIIFCEMYSGIVYHPYQEQFARRIVRSLLENDGEELTALFARQSGKSETVATTVGGCMIILPLLSKMFPNDGRLSLFKDGLWVGIFAPSERQAKITYNRIRIRLNSKSARAVLEDPDFNLTFNVSNGQTIALSNGSFASAISASDGASIEGESFKFIVCEECQDISNYKIRKSIHPMGAAYNATIVKIGTSTTYIGDFYEAIARNKETYNKDPKNSIKNHFEYDYRVVIKYNKAYAKYIEKEKKRFGENSDEFQMSYMLKWILIRGMFVSPTVFEKKNFALGESIKPYNKEKTIVASLDVAKKFDGSLLTFTEVDWDNPIISETKKNDDGTEEEFNAYDTQVNAWYAFEGDYETQYAAILHELSNYNVVRFVIDATREESLADRFKASLSYEVIPYIFTPSGKSILYKTLDREIRSARAKVPADELTQETPEHKAFLEQLYGLQKDYRGTNMVVAHASEKVHDDYPDSWALGVWGCSFPVENVVARTEGENPLTSRTKSDFYSSRNRLTSRRR